MSRYIVAQLFYNRDILILKYYKLRYDYDIIAF